VAASALGHPVRRLIYQADSQSAPAAGRGNYIPKLRVSLRIYKNKNPPFLI